MPATEPSPTEPADPLGAAAPGAPGGSDQIDFGDFDDLVAALSRWSGSLRAWPPAAAVQAEWDRIAPRLERARRELSRVLVVGVVGGTGTGKSTLVNALAGAAVSEAGDVARPTTTDPIVVAPPDIDLSWLPLEAVRARIVRSDSPAVANIVLVDCPDPDTQSEQESPPVSGMTASEAPPSAANRNRDLLERVLPACDVLLLVATAQKYKSWIVAREISGFAPGRPLFFVQTQASRDADIRTDWQRELESQGFEVPKIFRVDGVDAGRRAAAGLAPEPGFAALVAAIDEELVGRAARRVRRTGALDLAGWFSRDCAARLGPAAPSVRGLGEGVAAERSRLEKILETEVSETLRGQRHAWQRLVAAEIVERWQGGAFAMFVQVLDTLGALWRRTALTGGFVGQLLSGKREVGRGTAGDGWQAVRDLGLSEAEVEQSRSVLAGLAARARAEPLVLPTRIDEQRVDTLAATLLDRAGHWLRSGVERVVADRRRTLGGPLIHWTFEALFAALLGAVLARAGWGFFYGHLWQGRPVDGAGFLEQALVWLLVWGLLLRWGLLRLVRAGLDRDIAGLVAGLRSARLVEPFLADFAAAGSQMQAFLDEGRRLGGLTERLVARLDEPAGTLGRLRRGNDAATVVRQRGPGV